MHSLYSNKVLASMVSEATRSDVVVLYDLYSDMTHDAGNEGECEVRALLPEGFDALRDN